MWVRTTNQRIGYIQRYLPEDLWAELCIERVPVPKTQVDVRAPATAWRRTRDILYEEVFNWRGFQRSRNPKSLCAFIDHLAREIGYHERHPALKGKRMIGHHVECLYVWTQLMDTEQRIFSLYPNGGEFTVLKPNWHTFAGQKATIWELKGHSPHGDRLAEESAHLRCL